MKQRHLFEGELADDYIENVFPILIRKVQEVGEDVFLRWNGATIRVEEKDTPDTLMKKYDEAIRLVGLANKGIDNRDKNLYRIKNKIGEFYIVAHSFDEAAGEMKKRLDDADYGFFQERTVPFIELLAKQCIYEQEQVFSDREANLIIVGD